MHKTTNIHDKKKYYFQMEITSAKNFWKFPKCLWNKINPSDI